LGEPLAALVLLGAYLSYSWTLKMETVSPSVTSMNYYRNTRHRITEGVRNIGEWTERDNATKEGDRRNDANVLMWRRVMIGETSKRDGK
jgi:hypothetical protein